MNPDCCKMSSPKPKPTPEPKLQTVGDHDYKYGQRDMLADILETLVKSGFTWKQIAQMILDIVKENK